MNTRTQASVQHYLGETLGIRPTFAEWKDSDQIPYVIRSGYSFSEITFWGHRYIALTPKDAEEFSAAKVAKHLAWIDEHLQQTGIFVADGLEAYNRKRLIEQKVPFIIPGNQLYLPDLGIDLREHLRAVRKRPRMLSPSAQLLLLAKLLDKHTAEVWTATVLAEIFQSTKMTMSRAIDELESNELVEARSEGREKLIYFKATGRELWEKAQPVLRSPVQKRVSIEHTDWPIGTVAGLSALSARTMIAESSRKVWAITRKEWKALQIDANLRIIPGASSDLAPVELEIWKYNPTLLSEGGLVDPLSLYLSLADTTDERIEGALHDLLEDLRW
jgi:DNA-binding MarR family transcriptional regulator